MEGNNMVTRKSAKALALGAALITLTGAAAPSPQAVLSASPAEAWQDIPAEDMMIIRFKDGTSAIVQLAPEFAPVHVANIRKLVQTGWLDKAAIIRSQDNYVVQWGYPDDQEPPLPEGIIKTPPAEYEQLLSQAFKPLGYRDTFAADVGHVASWPVATDGTQQWLPHCYGMVGVARDVTPDTGSGTQLYAISGHAPRALDRNVAVVGRAISGMENLTTRPRGSEDLGFYKTPPEAGVLRLSPWPAIYPRLIALDFR